MSRGFVEIADDQRVLAGRLLDWIVPEASEGETIMTTPRRRRPVRGRTSRAAKTPTRKAATLQLRACRRRVATLEAQVARLEEIRAADRQAAQRRMARARQQFEARLTRMVQEIGQLRLHEARSRSLERTLAAKEREIGRLSELVQPAQPAAKVETPGRSRERKDRKGG